MRCYLPNGSVLNFKNGKSFKIVENIGQGASSVVYRAIYVNTNTEVLLKEYNPRRVAMHRNENGSLCPDSPADLQLFKEGVQQFKTAYDTQCFFLEDPELKNSTSHIQEIHTGYGTLFIEMHCFSGKSYEKVNETSLIDLLKRMKSITQVISRYHNKGYLHLDLKPDNIFVLPETCDMVMFFDFDSVIKKADLQKDNTRLAYTRSWAPPELTNPDRVKEIAECTDIYSLGMILFSKIIGRLPNPDEHRSTAKYPFNITTGLLADASQEILDLLTNIFHQTICRAPQNRWRNVQYLIAALDELIIIANQSQRTSRRNSTHTVRKRSKLKPIGAIAALLLLASGYAFVRDLSKSDASSVSNIAEPTALGYQPTTEPTESINNFVGYDYNGDALYTDQLVRIGGSASGDRYAVGTIIGMDGIGYAQVKFDSMYYANEYDPIDPHYIEDIETKILSNASSGGYVQSISTDMLQIYIFDSHEGLEIISPAQTEGNILTTESYVQTEDIQAERTESSIAYTQPVQEAKQYEIDTLVYNLEEFRSLVVTNAGTVYYLDGEYLYCSTSNVRWEIPTGDMHHQRCLTYDMYNDRVFLIFGEHFSVYDVTDIVNPVEVAYEFSLYPKELNYNQYIADQIDVFSDGSILVYASWGYYRFNPNTGVFTPFKPVRVLDDYDYLRLVGDNLVEIDGSIMIMAVLPLNGSDVTKVKIAEDLRWKNVFCAKPDGLYFYKDGTGVCKLDLSGSASVIISEQSIDVKDFQRLDNTDIQFFYINGNNRAVFYDHTLKCIRCISPVGEETDIFFATAFKNDPIQ